MQARYGDLVTTPVGPPGLRFNVTWLMSPDGAEEVFGASTCAGFRKDSPLYGEIRRFLGDGLLTAQDETWLRQKRFVQPLFTAARVDSQLTQMVAEIDRSADEISARVGSDGAELDLSPLMMRLTLRVVGAVLFGADVDRFSAVVDQHFSVLGHAVSSRGRSPIRLPMRLPLPAHQRALASQAALRSACADIITSRRATGDSHDDLVTRLIAARDGEQRLSDDEVRDQILVFLLAGHETTSSSLTFALHLLGRHPDVQTAVRQEVCDALGDGDPTAAIVKSDLPLTTAVVKEAMRLYPAVPLVGRNVAEDHEIAGRLVPAGGAAAVAPWAIHRRADLWNDPLRFDPSRFLDDADEHRHRYAWLPFGGGPRACIGQHFAMLESLTALAMLIRRFDFTAPTDLDDHVPVRAEITLRPATPVLSLVTAIK
jgi:cytochrome P450